MGNVQRASRRCRARKRSWVSAGRWAAPRQPVPTRAKAIVSNAKNGTVAASTVLGTINSAVSFLATPVLGEVALLAAVILLLRVMPRGITGRFFRGGV